MRTLSDQSSVLLPPLTFLLKVGERERGEKEGGREREGRGGKKKKNLERRG